MGTYYGLTCMCISMDICGHLLFVCCTTWFWTRNTLTIKELMEQLDVDNAIETRCGVRVARHGEEVNDFDIGPTLQGGGGGDYIKGESTYYNTTIFK